jgi:hypothetical protein
MEARRIFNFTRHLESKSMSVIEQATRLHASRENGPDNSSNDILVAFFLFTQTAADNLNDFNLQ